MKNIFLGLGGLSFALLVSCGSALDKDTQKNQFNQ
jgi:hypothetical protein